MLRDGKRWDAAGWVLCSTLMVYAHFYGVLVLVGQAGFVLAEGLAGGLQRTRGWLVAGVVVALLSGLAVRAMRGKRSRLP